MLRRWLSDNPTLLFLHVKPSGNKVADALENEGVGKDSSFHAEEVVEKWDVLLWEKCEALVGIDVGWPNVGHPHQMSTPPPLRQDEFYHAPSPSVSLVSSCLTRSPHVLSGKSLDGQVIRHVGAPLSTSGSGAKEDDVTHAPLGIYFTQNWIYGKRANDAKGAGGVCTCNEDDPASSPQL